MSTAHIVDTDGQADIATLMTDIGKRAKAAGRVLGTTDSTTKNSALLAMARSIRNNADNIIAENEIDMAGSGRCPARHI